MTSQCRSRCVGAVSAAVARHRIRSRRHDDGRIGMARRDFGIDVVAIVGAVAGEGGHRPLHLVEQGADLRAIIGILVGQHRRDDPAGVGVRREMQLSPGPAPPGAVLLDQPLARAAELQPRAVHQQVHRPAARLRPRHLQRLGPAAQGGVVRHGEIETEQLEDGADQPLGLAQRQAEHRAQRQRRRDRQVGVARLAAPLVRGSARHASIASSVNQTVRLPRARGRLVHRPVGHPVPLRGYDAGGWHWP